MHPENDLPFDGYIRISEVGGRQGPSFMSPHIQRETIDYISQLHRITLGEVVEEHDVSGGKKIKDRELGRLVAKVEAGESGGLIVWKLSRFSRKQVDSVETTHRIMAAGGRMLASDFDSASPGAKGILGFQSGMAEEELDLRSAVWKGVKVRAVERGVHISPNVPFGYKRGRGPVNKRTGKAEAMPLEIDPETAWAVPELFRMRAAGDSWAKLRDWLRAENLPTVRGADWSSTSVMSIVHNRVYLGEARGAGPDHVRVDAHPALVDEATWQAAQVRGRRFVLGDTGALLRGLVRCGGCRYTMQSRLGRPGAIDYLCNCKMGCPDPAIVTGIGLNGALGIDQVVVDMVRERERQQEERIVLEEFDPRLDIEADERDLVDLKLRLESASLDEEVREAVGREVWLKGLTNLRQQVDEKRAVIEEKLRQFGRPEGRPYVEFWEDWDSGEMPLEEKRSHLGSVIQAVFVNPNSRVRSRKDEELRRRGFANRIQIVWMDELPLVKIPRQGFGGYKMTPWPFPDASDSDPDALRVAT